MFFFCKQITSLIFHFLAVVLLLKFCCLRLPLEPEFWRKLHSDLPEKYWLWRSGVWEIRRIGGVLLLGLSPSLQPATHPCHRPPFLQSSPEINWAMRFAWSNMPHGVSVLPLLPAPPVQPHSAPEGAQPQAKDQSLFISVNLIPWTTLLLAKVSTVTAGCSDILDIFLLWAESILSLESQRNLA